MEVKWYKKILPDSYDFTGHCNQFNVEYFWLAKVMHKCRRLDLFRQQSCDNKGSLYLDV